MTDWVEEYIRWGLTRPHKPWQNSTATGYRRELNQLVERTGKRPEELGWEDLEGYQAEHRSESDSTWNSRYWALSQFYEFLDTRRFYEQPNAPVKRNPAKALKRRPKKPKQPAPAKDVLAVLADMDDEMDRKIATFLYHSGLYLSEGQSIKGPPVDGYVEIKRRGEWKWVPLRPSALDALTKLGGRVPTVAYQTRTVQRNWKRLYDTEPSAFTLAGRRDFQVREVTAEPFGPARALLVGRPDLLDVARACRDAAEALDRPKPNAADAITDAARALQEMFVAMGARGNSLGPLFDSVRKMGLFKGYDTKLIDVVERMVDWVNADRSERGDAHKETQTAPADALLTLRIVAALLERLEAMTPPR